jgi:hypothetical protein
VNSSKTQPSPSLDLELGLVAGALVGFVIAFEVNLLELLIWATGSYAGMDFRGFAGWSVQNAAPVVLGLLAAGMIGGLLTVLLSRFASALRPLAIPWVLSLWVLGTFVYAVFGGVRTLRAVHLVVVDALLAFALAMATYYVLCALLRWLRRGHVWRVILAVAAMTVSLWIPLAAGVGSS